MSKLMDLVRRTSGATAAPAGFRLRIQEPPSPEPCDVATTEPPATVEEPAREGCYVHGADASFWERPWGGWVCAACHPDPRQERCRECSGTRVYDTGAGFHAACADCGERVP